MFIVLKKTNKTYINEDIRTAGSAQVSSASPWEEWEVICVASAISSSHLFCLAPGHAFTVQVLLQSAWKALEGSEFLFYEQCLAFAMSQY